MGRICQWNENKCVRPVCFSPLFLLLTLNVCWYIRPYQTAENENPLNLFARRLRDYSFSTYAKCSKKLTFLTSWHARLSDCKKLTLLHGCFSRFLNCTNGTKSRNAPQNVIFYSESSFRETELLQSNVIPPSFFIRNIKCFL